jgi:hypothetical protein
MGFSQGFAAGFGMVDNAMHRRQQMQMSQADRDEEKYRFGLQQQRLAEQDQVAAQQARINQAAMGLDPNWNPEQQEQYVLGRQRQDNFNAQSQAQAEAEAARRAAILAENKTNAEIANMQAQAGERKAKAGEIENNAMLAKINLNSQQVNQRLERARQGVATPGDIEWLMKNEESAGYLQQIKNRVETYQTFASNYESLNQQYDQALASGDQAVAQSIQMDMMDYLNNSPEAIDTMNSAFYQSFADRVKADPTINAMSFAGFEFVDGGVVPLMNITYADGTKKQGVPATRNKSADPNDELAVLPIHVIKQQVANVMSISGALNAYEAQNPDVKGLFSKRGENEKNMVLGANSMLVDPRTNEVLLHNTRTDIPPSALISRLNSIDKQLNAEFSSLSDEARAQLINEQRHIRQQLNLESPVESTQMTAPSGLPRQPVTGSNAPGASPQEVMEAMKRYGAQ